MNIETSTITIGSLLALAGFIFAVIGFYQNYKSGIRKESESEIRLITRLENTESEIRNLKKDYTELKKDYKADFTLLQNNIGEKINNFDHKLDTIRDMIIDMLKSK